MATPCPAHRSGLVVREHDRGMEGLAPRCGKPLPPKPMDPLAPDARYCWLQAGHPGGCE